MVQLADGVSFVAASAGTGTFVFSAGRVSYLTLAQAEAAGEIADGDLVSYLAVNNVASPSQREWGHGTYSLAGNSIARTTVLGTVNGSTAGVGSPLSFSVAPTIFLTALAEDINGGVASSTYPGDVLTLAGTPPVAAHGMARKLFAAYTGYLFRVRRTSDNAVQDIGTAADGWADVVSLLAFLGTSPGTVVQIYDQTGNNNILPQATNANQGALTIVYTTDGRPIPVVSINLGQFYRNRASTSLIPTGANPITLYSLITNDIIPPGIGYYGDMEATVADTGSGHMFALAWAYNGGGLSGAGLGPWIGVDWENGLYNAATAHASTTAPAQDEDFIFSLSKSNGSTRWVIKGNPATTPHIQTLYDGTLPTGYTQNLEGGISLGEGGDGTASAVTFVEGAIVAGFTTDAADQNILTNISASLGVGSWRLYPGYVFSDANVRVGDIDTAQNGWGVLISSPISDTGDTSICINWINIAFPTPQEYFTTCLGAGSLAQDGGALTSAAVRNTAIGYAALSKLTSGYQNVALGSFAAFRATTDYDIVAIGDYAYVNGIGGFQNTAIGQSAMGSGSTGSQNIAIGYNAMNGGTNAGTANICIGTLAGNTLSTGSNNTFFGPQTGQFCTTGSGNFGFGPFTLLNIGAGNTNIGIGYLTLAGGTTFNSIAMGFQAGASVNGAQQVIYIGYQAGYSTVNYPGFNIAIGSQAWYSSIGSSYSVAIGYQALYNQGSAADGSYNIGIGYQAGYNLTGGTYNTLIGGWTGPSGSISNVIALSDGQGNLKLDYNYTTASVWTSPASLQIGNTASASTATPLFIDLGATYSSVAGAHLKLRLYNDGSTTPYGLGVSAGSLDYLSGGVHNWYVGLALVMALSGTALAITSTMALSWNGDTSVSRIAAGQVGIGNGTPGNESGQLNCAYVATYSTTGQQPGLYIGILGDAHARLLLSLDGSDKPVILFGTGSATQDTGLSRTGAAVIAIGNGTSGDSSGTIQAKTKAGAPTTSDVPASTWALIRDTTNSTTKIYYNNAGTLQSVALV